MPIQTVSTISTGPARTFDGVVERHGNKDGRKERQKQDTIPVFLCCPCLAICLGFPCCADELCTACLEACLG